MITRSAILDAVNAAPDWFWTDDNEENLGSLADLLNVPKWTLVRSELCGFALEAIACR